MTKEELHLPEGGNLNLDSINYSDLPLPNPSLYPADGAEEYLKMALGGNMNISTLSLNFWYEVMTEFATLHAQRIADKKYADTEADGYVFCGKCGKMKEI